MKTTVCKIAGMLILMSVLGINAYSQDSGIIEKGARLEVVFTNDLTKDDLEQIRKELVSRNIFVEYTEFKFDKKGRLTGIDFKVRVKDATEEGRENSGSARAMPLPAKGRFGFFVDNSEGAPAVFGTGGLDGN